MDYLSKVGISVYGDPYEEPPVWMRVSVDYPKVDGIWSYTLNGNTLLMRICIEEGPWFLSHDEKNKLKEIVLKYMPSGRTGIMLSIEFLNPKRTFPSDKLKSPSEALLHIIEPVMPLRMKKYHLCVTHFKGPYYLGWL